jgi:flagellar hook-associated protein 3 FlgL
VRISTSMMYEMGVSRLGEQQNGLNKTQQQVATGRKILTPADDPAGAASVLRVSQADAMNTQHAENRNLTRNSLGIEDGVLASVSDLLQAIKATVIGAGNGTLGNAERGFMASELRGQLEQLVGLANSSDGNGNYLFSGFQSRTLPFAQVGSTVNYAGDAGVRALQVSADRQLAIGDSGQSLFMSVPQGNGRFVAAAGAGNSGSGKISAGTVTNPASLTGQDYQIDFSVVAGVTTYSVTNVTTGSVLSAGHPYSDGGAIDVDGMQVQIKGSPANGDQFTLGASGRQSLFDVVNDLITALATPVVTSADSARLSNALTAAGSGLENAFDKVLETRASVGARLKELDALEDTGSYMHLQYQTRLSELQDLDYNEALSRLAEDAALNHTQNLSRLQDVDYARALSDLAEEQVYLEAAQKSFIQVTGLSLFKYL